MTKKEEEQKKEVLLLLRRDLADIISTLSVPSSKILDLPWMRDNLRLKNQFRLEDVSRAEIIIDDITKFEKVLKR